MVLSDATFFNISLITAACYFASASLVAIAVARKKSVSDARTLILSTAAFAIACHALLITQSYISNNGLTQDLFGMLSLVFLVIGLLFTLTALNKSIEALGIIVFPFSALAVVLNSNNASVAATAMDLSTAMQAHIVLSVLSYSLLTVAAFQAIILSIQERQLHNRQPGRFISSLPPLQLMEGLMIQTIMLGVFLLTFALASGFIFLEDIFAQHLVHKTVLSIVAWLVFSTLLWGRFYLGWRGQQAIKWTYGGYFSLMLAYFGSKFVLQLVLS